MFAIVGTIGLIALISPRLFFALAKRSSQWVDTDQALKSLDRRIDIDGYVLPYSRYLGLAVLAAVVILASVWLRR